MNHFIQECALIPIGQDQALMDAAGQREGATRRPYPCEDGDRLTGVPEDILRLGVRVGGLVQLFDGRHFPPRFGDLEPIADKDRLTSDPVQARVNAEHQGAPQPRECPQIQRRTVKEVEQAVVAPGPESQRTDEARHAHEVLSGRHPHQARRHP